MLKFYPFTCMGPFRFYVTFYTYIGPFTTIWDPFTPVRLPQLEFGGGLQNCVAKVQVQSADKN